MAGEESCFMLDTPERDKPKQENADPKRAGIEEENTAQGKKAHVVKNRKHLGKRKERWGLRRLPTDAA